MKNEPQFIVIEGNRQQRDLISLCIEGFLGGKVIDSNCGMKALEILKEDKNICGIVAGRFPWKHKKSFYELTKYSAPHIPVLLIADSSPFSLPTYQSFFNDHENNHFILAPFSSFILSDDFFGFHLLSWKTQQAIDLVNYCSVNIHKILKYNNFTGSIHIKLADQSMVKYCQTSGQIDKEILYALNDNGVECLYLTKNEFIFWVRELAEKIHAKLELSHVA